MKQLLLRDKHRRRGPELGILSATILACLLSAFGIPAALADNDVMLQGFYWDCPQDWYAHLQAELSELATAGFTTLWLPPPSKGMAGGYSMGYDVFDHYDLGEYDQQGTVATRFGTSAQLKQLIRSAHTHKLQVLADIVLNHMMGGRKEANPKTGTRTWSAFSYPHGKFQKDWRCFHPSNPHPDNGPPYHSKDFGEDFCHANPYVATELQRWGDWLIDDVGFDGFRLDFVKGIEPWYVKTWVSGGKRRGRFVVGEFWDADRPAVEGWLDAVGPGVSAFDFPLFYTLKAMCNDSSGSFDMRKLNRVGLAATRPFNAVTFVENHDTDRHDPVVTDKMMAYAHILISEGFPCVFYKDYATYGLKPKVDQLISIRKRYAGGTSSTLHTSDDLYVMQRNGSANAPGCVLVLNDHASEWKGAWVKVKWRNANLRDATGVAQPKWVNNDGWVQLWAPPRGYAVYVQN